MISAGGASSGAATAKPVRASSTPIDPNVPNGSASGAHIPAREVDEREAVDRVAADAHQRAAVARQRVRCQPEHPQRTAEIGVETRSPAPPTRRASGRGSSSRCDPTGSRACRRDPTPARAPLRPGPRAHPRRSARRSGRRRPARPTCSAAPSHGMCGWFHAMKASRPSSLGRGQATKSARRTARGRGPCSPTSSATTALTGSPGCV